MGMDLDRLMGRRQRWSYEEASGDLGLSAGWIYVALGCLNCVEVRGGRSATKFDRHTHIKSNWIFLFACARAFT